MADIKRCNIAEPHQRHNWTEAWPGGNDDGPIEVYYHGCPGVSFPASQEDLERAIAKLIWETSHRDEGTISATGADIIARSLVAAGYGTFGQERPQETTARELLDRMLNSPEVTQSSSGSIWRFVKRFERELPTLPASLPIYDIPPGHVVIGGRILPMPPLYVGGVKQDPSNPEAWKISPNRIMEVPEAPPHPLLEVLERIAEAIENSGPDNDALQSIAGALDDMERHQR